MAFDATPRFEAHEPPHPLREPARLEGFVDVVLRALLLLPLFALLLWRTLDALDQLAGCPLCALVRLGRPQAHYDRASQNNYPT
jgi:hypothetical protein